MPDWTTAEWAQVIAAASAAFAAVAASVAVGLSVRQQRRANQPNLSAGVTHGVPSGRLGASFANGGPGIAVQVAYMVVCGDFKKVALVNDGHLAVGEKSTLDFGYASPPGEQAYFVWSCRDTNSNVYVWSAEWESRRWSRREWLQRKDHSMESMFKVMYPDVPIPEQPRIASLHVE